MRIILATAHPYLPQIAGGAQSNMHETAVALKERGHHVTVVAGLTGSGLIGLSARVSIKLGRSFYTSNQLGYPVIRTWFPWQAIVSIVRHVAPDVVVAQSGLPSLIAEAFRGQDVPTVIHLHNVEDDDLVGISATSANAFIANSQFTAERAARQYGISAQIIVPSFIRERYITQSKGDFITLINPHRKKGVEKMIEIVRRMPNQRFLFAKAWTLSKGENDSLACVAKSLPNLTLRESSSDMREVYAQTKVLVVPSIWEEAWGRVVTEAQFSGIPIVGADRGGIPEAIGPGGIVLSADANAGEWVDALSGLLNNTEYYARLSQAALDYSERDEIDLSKQMEALEKVCIQAIARHPDIDCSSTN